MTTQEKLNAIFCEVFDDEDIKIHPATTAKGDDALDSLSHVNLVVAVEAKLGIRFAQKELLTFKGIGELLNCIEKRLSEAL